MSDQLDRDLRAAAAQNLRRMGISPRRPSSADQETKRVIAYLKLLCECGQPSVKGPPVERCFACKGIDKIEELRAALARAEEVLGDNLALANKNARAFQAERDSIIREMRKKYSAVEIADMVGLTRQRVHQILNEGIAP